MKNILKFINFSFLPGDNILNLVESIDEEKLDDITNVLIGDYPNTYTYTKAIAEQVVKQYAKDLPAGIFRPAIGIFNFFNFLNL